MSTLHTCFVHKKKQLTNQKYSYLRNLSLIYEFLTFSLTKNFLA